MDCFILFFFLFKQKTAYEMRISDWSSDVCSSDLRDCLDGPYALGAWEDLQAEIADGAIPNYSWEQFMNDLGLNSLGQEEYEKFGKTYNRSILTDINRMINRVAALTDRRQEDRKSTRLNSSH